MATKKVLQKHLVEQVDEAIINRERKPNKGLLSRPIWSQVTAYQELETAGTGSGGDFTNVVSTSSYTIDGVTLPVGSTLATVVTNLLGTDVASITYDNTTGTLTLVHSDGSTSTTTIGMEDDRTLTTSSLTIDGVSFPAGSTLSSVLTALVTAETQNGEFRGSVADSTALAAISSPVNGDLAYVTNSNGVSGGSSGVPAIVAHNGTAWSVVQLFNTTSDTSITTGTLSNATGSRVIPMNNQDLVFDSVGVYREEAVSYVQGDGAGGGLADIDSDATAYIKTTVTSSGVERRMNKLATQVLSGAGDPVNGTTVAWYVGQIYRNTSDNTLWAATAKSTNPDGSGGGSTWVQVQTGTGIQQYTSGQAEIWATGTGITFSVNASTGEWVFAIPAGVNLLKANISFALSDTDTASSNKAYILFDYADLRSFNTDYTDANFPSSLGVIPNAAGSRSTPANLTIRDYGISAIGGGAGSDLEITVTNAPVAVDNQMIIQFSHF